MNMIVRRLRWLSLAALSVVAMATMLSTANALVLTADLEDFTNGGGFFGTITITDTGPNQVSIVLDIADPINAGLTQGDILGVWFDVTNEAILAALQSAFDLDPATVFQNIVPAGTIQAALFDANNVNSVGTMNNNLNGGGG